MELEKKEIINERMVKKLAVVTPKGQPVPETIEIKTSKLLNVIEKEKYDNLQDMIDVVDFEARMKIKKADWFINPEHSLTMRKRMFLEKSLCYSKNVLNQKLQPFKDDHRATSGANTQQVSPRKLMDQQLKSNLSPPPVASKNPLIQPIMRGISSKQSLRTSNDLLGQNKNQLLSSNVVLPGEKQGSDIHVLNEASSSQHRMSDNSISNPHVPDTP